MLATSAAEALTAVGMHRLRLVQLVVADAHESISATVQLAGSMQQAPPLGLQHTLQLMRPAAAGLKLTAKYGTDDAPKQHRLLDDAHVRSLRVVRSISDSTIQQQVAVSSEGGACGHGLEAPRVTYHPVELCNDAALQIAPGQLLLSAVHVQLSSVSSALVTLQWDTAGHHATLELNDARHYNAVSACLVSRLTKAVCSDRRTCR